MQGSVNPSFVQLSFQKKAQLFHELAQLVKSGIPMNKGLEIMSRGSNSVARASQRIARELTSRGSVSAAFQAAGFTTADGVVIEAGETTGRLEEIFLELERYYGELATARKLIIKRSIYPFVILHLGAVLMAIAPAILGDGWSTFWWAVISLLAKFYGVFIPVILILWGARKLFATNSLAGRIIAAVPMIGGFITSWTAWKFSMVFSLYVRSGGGLLKGMAFAGKSSESAILETASAQAVQRVQSGQGLAEALRSSHLPETLERAVEVGEVSGRLDEEVQRAAAIFKERFFQRLNTFGIWVPQIIYVGILLLVGYRIIQSYSQTMGTIQSVINGSM